MIVKQITYEELYGAVEISLSGDVHVFEFYDPDVKVQTLEDIVADIPRKIKTFGSSIVRGVYEKDELIGYFAYQGRILISFGLAVKYRVRKYLREFFNLINKELKKDFVVYLWKKNIRAIRWLQKHGLEISEYSAYIVKLVAPTNEVVYN